MTAPDFSDSDPNNDLMPYSEGRTNALMAAIIDGFADAVVATSLDGIVMSWNHAASRLFGVTSQEAVGNKITGLALPEEVRQSIGTLQNTLLQGKPEASQLVQFDKDGKRVAFDTRMVAITDSRRQPIGISIIANDVSQQRGISEKLDASERRFQTITNVVPQIIWQNDTNGKAVYFNDRWFEYTGLSYEESAGDYRGWQIVTHPDDDIANERWEQALQAGDFFESEARLRNQFGGYEWHLLKNIPLKNEENKIVGWFGSATNIQHLKQMEEELRATSTKLRAILEAAVDFSIVTLNKDGYITDMNSGAERMFGYQREEAIGMHTRALFTNEDDYAGVPEREFDVAKKTGRSINERWHVRKDGSRFFMSGVLTPINDSFSGFVKVSRDITERKLAEEALFLSEQRNSLAIQSAQIGEWDYDIPSETIELNEQACALAGVEAKQQQQTKDFICKQLFHPDDREAVEYQIKLALDGLNIFQSQLRITRADSGQVKWVNAYGRVISHRDGRPVRMIGVVYDITDRVLLDKQKDDFISVASHELRTPVTSIKGYSELLEDNFEKAGDQRNASLLKKLNDQIDRLVQLIHSLLDISIISEGRLKIRPETFDLNVLVEEQLQALRLIAAGHELIWNATAIPLIHADRDRIGQVITNLISNATKYSPIGSQVIISTLDRLDSVMVRVQDFGSGLPAGEQQRIFERYYRASLHHTSDKQGLGLGLYISSQIIHQHHGTIGVESLAGKGSTFYFTLPYS